MHVGVLREAGWTPRDVLRAVMPWLGLPGHDRLEAAATAFDPAAEPLGPIQVMDAECPSPAEGVSWQLVPEGGSP